MKSKKSISRKFDLNDFHGNFFQVNDKTEEDNNNNVLIQKQSKDETTIEILSDTATDSEKIAVKGGRNVIDALNDIVQTLLPATIKSKKEFDPDEFYTKLMQYPLYEVNQSWVQDYSVMSCPAKVFKERFSIQGEFFDTYL